MLKRIIDECFADLRERKNPGEGKIWFTYMWAVLASKRTRFVDEDYLQLSWRELSAELSYIYNQWYNCRFTTDAFLGMKNPDTKFGEDSIFDEATKRIVGLQSCIGIFRVLSGPSVSSQTNFACFSEINIMTSEQIYYKQPYKNGKSIGPTVRILGEEYEELCYSAT